MAAVHTPLTEETRGLVGHGGNRQDEAGRATHQPRPVAGSTTRPHWPKESNQASSAVSRSTYSSPSLAPIARSLACPASSARPTSARALKRPKRKSPPKRSNCSPPILPPAHPPRGKRRRAGFQNARLAPRICRRRLSPRPAAGRPAARRAEKVPPPLPRRIGGQRDQGCSPPSLPPACSKTPSTRKSTSSTPRSLSSSAASNWSRNRVVTWGLPLFHDRRSDHRQRLPPGHGHSLWPKHAAVDLARRLQAGGLSRRLPAGVQPRGRPRHNRQGRHSFWAARCKHCPNGSRSGQPGRSAVGILNLDGEPPAEALEAVRALPAITSAVVVELPAAGVLPRWVQG